MEQQLSTALINLDNSISKNDLKESNKQIKLALVCRKNISETQLSSVYKKFLKEEPPHLAVAMDLEEPNGEGENKVDPHIVQNKELKLALELLIIMKVIDNKNFQAAYEMSSKAISELGMNILNLVQAKFYFYLQRAAEYLNINIKPMLMEGYRKFCIKKDVECQAILLNCLLRFLLVQEHEIEQAKQVVEKCNFAQNCSNGQQARYLYYTGRIDAISTDY